MNHIRGGRRDHERNRARPGENGIPREIALLKIPGEFTHGDESDDPERCEWNPLRPLEDIRNELKRSEGGDTHEGSCRDGEQRVTITETRSDPPAGEQQSRYRARYYGGSSSARRQGRGN